jgi:hypothetical protein
MKFNELKQTKAWRWIIFPLLEIVLVAGVVLIIGLIIKNR